MIHDYEINKDTLAVLAINSSETKIIERNQTFVVEQTTKNIIDRSCKFFGSSYQGRSEGTRQILGSKYRLPIIIEETHEIVFFPLTSPRLPLCSWISLKNIKKYHEDQNHTIVEFCNGETLVVDTLSYGAFDNQVLRSSRLSHLLHERKIN